MKFVYDGGDGATTSSDSQTWIRRIFRIRGLLFPWIKDDLLDVKTLQPDGYDLLIPRPTILPCESKRQYLITLQVSRYCLLDFQGSIHILHLGE